jgi:enoyl-CoA hydratase
MDLETDQIGAVRIFRLNRPEARNSLNAEILTGIGLGMKEADADPEVGAVIVTGTGDRAFCAGMDLRGFAQGGGTPSTRDSEGTKAYQAFIRTGISKPVIGAANATAVAGGFELLLACDMIVASDQARFGLPEVKRALFPAGGGVFISKRIPLALALELCLTGDYFDAARAQALGLVNRVTSPDKVMDEALALAGTIAGSGPIAIKAIKSLVRAAAQMPPDQVWAMQEELHPVVFGSEDAKEGATAFIEKRDPVWKGR